MLKMSLNGLGTVAPAKPPVTTFGVVNPNPAGTAAEEGDHAAAV